MHSLDPLNYSLSDDANLISRGELARRWSCSKETLKRRERAGILHPMHLPGKRLVRYRLSDILAIEAASRRD
jgi:hypothetical protein